MSEHTLAVKHHVSLAKQCVDSVFAQLNSGGIIKANYEQLWATLARAIVYLRSTDEIFVTIDSKAKGM
jgi:hypothetical protein